MTTVTTETTVTTVTIVRTVTTVTTVTTVPTVTTVSTVTTSDNSDNVSSIGFYHISIIHLFLHAKKLHKHGFCLFLGWLLYTGEIEINTHAKV